MQSTVSSSRAAFTVEEDPRDRSFFSEIIQAVTDVKFSPDGRFIMSRDYLTLKLWDVNMGAKPVKTYNVHDLKSKFGELYESENLFDKFDCSFNSTGTYVVNLQRFPAHPE